MGAYHQQTPRYLLLFFRLDLCVIPGCRSSWASVQPSTSAISATVSGPQLGPLLSPHSL
jgi:hypothetical protein